MSVNSSVLDCKTVGLFLKISREVGKAWHVRREKKKRIFGVSPQSRSLFSALFQTFCFAVYLCSEVCSLKCCQLYPSIYISQIAVQSLQNGTQCSNNNRNYYDYDYYLFIYFGCSLWRIQLQQNLTIFTNPRWMCCLIGFKVSLLPLLSLCSQCDP